ncbi:hypothetical protein [Thalassoroseus pseudoceratinae]|uniref:hypothetical protein n=1 Tax=Thalassoroseus pseudoceratinae TaxID=2713176 RepID=UPI0014247BEA|nr:hypothetical protein [Thalassoroseus pseudoceratinae]
MMPSIDGRMVLQPIRTSDADCGRLDSTKTPPFEQWTEVLGSDRLTHKFSPDSTLVGIYVSLKEVITPDCEMR